MMQQTVVVFHSKNKTNHCDNSMIFKNMIHNWWNSNNKIINKVKSWVELGESGTKRQTGCDSGSFATDKKCFSLSLASVALCVCCFRSKRRSSGEKKGEREREPSLYLLLLLFLPSRQPTFWLHALKKLSHTGTHTHTEVKSVFVRSFFSSPVSRSVREIRYVVFFLLN